MSPNNYLIRTSIILITFLIFLNSCAPLYIPSDVNAPLFTKEGEAAVSLNFGTNGFNYSGAYALTDNLAFQINVQNLAKDIQRNDKNKINARDPKQEINYYEAALGFYNPIDENKVVEIYAGFGVGNASALDKFNIFTSDKIYAEGEYYKMFLQADVGAKMDVIEGGIAIRLAELHYSNLKFENYEFDGETSSIFFEPALFLRLGGPNFKFKAQLGFASKLRKEEFIQYESMKLSVGFILRIDLLAN